MGDKRPLSSAWVVWVTDAFRWSHVVEYTSYERKDGAQKQKKIKGTHANWRAHENLWQGKDIQPVLLGSTSEGSYPLIQLTTNQKYLDKKFQKDPKGEICICFAPGSYLHSVYIVFGIINNLEMV